MSAGTARDKSHGDGIYVPMCLNWQGRHITYDF